MNVYACTSCKGEFKVNKTLDKCPGCGEALTLTSGIKINKKKGKSLRHLMSSLIRKEVLDGKPHLVCPTVLMTEGVRNKGLYTSEEMSKCPQAWDGTPVVVFHPEQDGQFISANSPEIKEKQTIGTLFHSSFDDSLKSEVWIDVEKAQSLDLGQKILEMLQQNEHVEVSTGVYTEDEVVQGKYNGETYEFIPHNHIPDHLALLPGGKGACSWEDGAGMPRVNELSHDQIWSALREELKQKVNPNMSADGPFVFVKAVFDKFVIFEKEDKEGSTDFKQSYSIDAEDNAVMVGDPVEVKEERIWTPVKTNVSADTIQWETGGVVNAKDALHVNPITGQHSARLRKPGDFDPDSFRTTKGGTIFGSKKVPSTVNIIWGKLKGKAESADPVLPQALRFKMSSWTVATAKKWLKDNKVKFVSFEKGKKAPKSQGKIHKPTKEVKMDREKQVEALITNGSWSEEDREFLKGLEDEQFSKIEKLSQNEDADASQDDAPADKDAADGDKEDKDDAKDADKDVDDAGDVQAPPKDNEDEKPETVKSYVAKAPGEIQEVLNESVKMHKAEKAGLIKALLANKRNEFTEEELKAKKLGELKKLTGLGRVKVDYSGRANGLKDDEDDPNKVDPMPEMKFDAKGNALPIESK